MKQIRILDLTISKDIITSIEKIFYRKDEIIFKIIKRINYKLYLIEVEVPHEEENKDTHISYEATCSWGDQATIILGGYLLNIDLYKKNNRKNYLAIKRFLFLDNFLENEK